MTAPAYGSPGPLVGLEPENFISAYLENASSNDMTVDGSSTPVLFTYNPPAGKKLIGGRLLFYMEGATAFSSIQFANITALTNGVQILVNNVVLDNWQDNVDLVTTFFDAEGEAAFSKIDRSLAGRWTLTNAAGGFDGLSIEITDGISLNIRDDLLALVIYRAKIQGRLVDI